MLRRLFILETNYLNDCGHVRQPKLRRIESLKNAWKIMFSKNVWSTNKNQNHNTDHGIPWNGISMNLSLNFFIHISCALAFTVFYDEKCIICMTDCVRRPSPSHWSRFVFCCCCCCHWLMTRWVATCILEIHFLCCLIRNVVEMMEFPLMAATAKSIIKSLVTVSCILE